MLKSLWDDFRGVEVNPPPKKTGITVTEAALKKIETMVDENGMIGVRPYVYGGGCSGMAHSMTFVDQIDERDTEVAPYLYIDPIAYQFMDGATIDYDISGMSPTFIFKDVFKAQGGTGTCGGCGAAQGPGNYH
jgi:iron-sulfur cluster assembly accessory protein